VIESWRHGPPLPRHDGLVQALALPVGQNTQAAGQPAPAKIFRFTEFRNCVYFASLRPKEEGRIAIVTNAGRTAADAGHTGANGFAGRATVSEGVAHTTGAALAYGKTVSSW